MMWLLALMACGGDRPPPTRPPPEEPAPPSGSPESGARAPADAEPPLRFVEAAGHGEPLPLVVVVHGLGDAPPSMVRLLARYPRPLRIVAPEGVKTYGDGFSWFDIHWEGGRGTFDSAEVAAAADKIVALARWVADRSGVAGEPVLTGFSQGGILTFVAAVRHRTPSRPSSPSRGTSPRTWCPWTARAPAGAPSGRSTARPTA